MSKRDPLLAALGLNVRKRREARELTQEKLAEKSGLDATYISDIERGLRNAGIKNVAKTSHNLCGGNGAASVLGLCSRPHRLVGSLAPPDRSALSGAKSW